MSQTGRAVNGLFDWLKSEDATKPEAPSAAETSSEERVVALRKELLEAAQAQMNGAENAQDMIALLDALRVAERNAEADAPESANSAFSSDAADDFGAEPTMPASGADYLGTTIRDLASDGWLIEALHGGATDTQPLSPFQPLQPTELGTASVLEGDWTVESKLVEESVEERVIETDNRAELDDGDAADAESEPPAPAEAVLPGPSVKDRVSALAVPMMTAFMGGAARARQMAQGGMQQAGAALARQQAAMQARAAERQAAQEIAAAEMQAQEAQRRAEQEAEMPAPAPVFENSDLRLPQAPAGSAYTPEAVEAILTIPEARWSPTAEPASTIVKRLPDWLEEKLALHARWLESNGAEGKRYRYTGEDFSGLNLAGQNFASAQMRGAVLAGVDLSQARFDGADLSEADLSRAIMVEVHAPRAIFARADLTYADLSGLHAPQANLNFADLQGAKLKEASLESAQMREVNFQGVVAPELRLMGANLRNARLFESILPGADLRGADLRGAQLERVVFLGANLAGASLKDAQILGLDYAQTDFTVALDVPQDIQLAALAAERTKLNEARISLDARTASLQARESRLMANLRVLEHKRHHDGQFEAQETEAFERLASHARWLRRGSFWWAGTIALLFGVVWTAMSEVPLAGINLPVLGLIASFGVVTAGLAILSAVRIWRIRRTLDQLLRHRTAARAAIAAQAVQEAAAV